MPVIYVDVLLTLNLFVDYVLVCSVARLLSRPTKRRRRLVAAAVGAMSALVILVPLPWWLTLIWQVVWAAGMVAVAFPFESPRTFLKTTTVFLIVSALYAGICFAITQWLAPRGLFVRSGVVYYDVPPLMLAAFTAFSYGVLCLYERFTRKRVAFHTAFRVEIRDGDDRVMLRAMLDSGHSLTERFSGAPVIIVRAEAVRPIAARFNPHNITRHTAARIRYIPFSTLGGEGILTAFRPETVRLHGRGTAVDISGTWIACTPRLHRGEYDALIGPAVSDRLCGRPY